MNSGDLDERDVMILRHLARNRFSFKEVLRCLFFDGADPQKALDRLRDKGYMTARKGFGGNRSAYQLEPKGATVVGTGRRRADALGPEALAIHLAIYAFCFLCGRPRIRLEDNELAKLFGGQPPPGRNHCLERSTRAVRVFHLYVPGDATQPTDVLDATHEHIRQAGQRRELESWVSSRVYSFAVLVESRDRARELQSLFDRSKDEFGRSLRDVAVIRVEQVPGLGNIEEALRELA